MRGAISYALALHLEFEDEKRHVIVTTTLIIVLFTTLVLGGSTMPLMKVIFIFSHIIFCSLFKWHVVKNGKIKKYVVI